MMRWSCAGPLGPRERAASRVVGGDEPVEEFFKLLLGALHAVRQPLLAEDAEKTFEKIQPRRVGRSVMKLDPGMAAEPSTSCFILVDVQVIHHAMELAVGIGAHHVIHEAQEVPRGVPVADVSD